MSNDRLKPGLKVYCNVRGRRFWAKLIEPDPQVQSGWIIEPEARNITYYHVTNRQIEEVEKRWTPDKAVIRRPSVANH